MRTHAAMTITAAAIALTGATAGCESQDTMAREEQGGAAGSGEGAALAREALEPETDRVRKLLGEGFIGALDAPDRLEVYRIGLDGPAGAEKIGEWDVLGRGIDPDDAWRTTLREILYADDSWVWDMAKGCDPIPGVAVRVVAGGEMWHVAICFDCDILYIIDPDGTVRGEDFDPVRSGLVKLSKTALPDDAVIQGLKASG